MRRRSKVLVALAFVLSCLMGCVPVVAAKPARAKPVVTAKPKPKPKPKPVTPAKSPVVAPGPTTFEPPAPGDWTGWEADDAATGDNPYETSITAANVHDLHEVWSAPSGRSAVFPTPPLVAGGLVFDTEVTGGDPPKGFVTTLSAYDLESGALRWQRELTGQQEVVGVADGMLQVVNFDFGSGSAVQTFDQKTGVPRWTWQAPVGGQITGTVVTGSGHLFVPFAGGLYALDPSTGHELFVITCTEADTNCPFNLLGGVAAQGGVLYSAGFETSAGEEFSTVDGHRENGLGVPYGLNTFTGPVISGGQVFLSTVAMGPNSHLVGEVASFSTTPCGQTYCTPQWKVDLPGGAGQVAIANGRLFVLAGGDGILYALDPSNGRVLWTGSVGPDENGFLSIAGDVLYVAQGLTINAFPAAGCASATSCQPLWQYRTPDEVQTLDAPAVVTGGRLLYANFSGLHAFAVN